MNIVIAVSKLGLKGGAQRTAVRLASEMLARGHSPQFYAFAPACAPAYAVDLDKTPCSFFPLHSGEQRQIAAVRNILVRDKVDVFISLEANFTHFIWALCCLGTGIPFICSERSDPRHSETATWNKAGRHATLSVADAIHELLAVHTESVPARWASKTHVIPNAVPLSSLPANPAKADGTLTLLFLGRYTKTKRVDLLVKAFAQLAPEYPQWNLRLVGHGNEKPHIQDLVKKLQLGNRIQCEGPTETPGAEYAQAQIYCLPTEVEGFPNTLLEAMAAGLPVVGVEDCPAMRSIIEHGRTGFLAPEATPESLAATLQPLLASAVMREEIGRNARLAVEQNYNPNIIFNQWESLLLTMAQHKGHTIMDSFNQEPFASQARLSSVARREWLYRNFGDPMPYSLPWIRQRASNLVKNLLKTLQQKTGEKNN